uniref:Uncharacterized protein LOC116937914 n=1 Tax=Petromyzon marinus TaxID=7757 RepID=A0AAJ7SLL6_PETMA|nr:uncharacterized protein LOC116937914 [Petromyzon marinus]
MCLVIKEFRTFVAKSRSSRGKGVMARFKVPDLLKHLMERYGAPDIHDLGIRITSIPLGISVIGKAQKGEREAMDRGLARIECDIKQEVEDRPHKIKKYLLESFPLPGTSADLRRQFTTQPAAEMVLQVFQYAEDIFVNKLKKVGHVVLLTKACIAYIIPDTPSHVRACMRRERFVVQTILQQAELGRLRNTLLTDAPSSPPSPQFHVEDEQAEMGLLRCSLHKESPGVLHPPQRCHMENEQAEKTGDDSLLKGSEEESSNEDSSTVFYSV